MLNNVTSPPPATAPAMQPQVSVAGPSTAPKVTSPTTTPPPLANTSNVHTPTNNPTNNGTTTVVTPNPGSGSLLGNMPGNGPSMAAPVSTAPPSDSFSRGTTNTGTVDLIGNMPGSQLSEPVEPTTANTDAGIIDFFPTNDATVLFNSEQLNQPGGLGLQVLIADGADPNFNAALAALAAQNPEAVLGMIQARGNDNYVVNFYVQGNQNQNGNQQNMRQVQIEVTDNFLPRDLPQDAQGNSVIWAALINKAYAKLLDMEALNASNNDPLSAMTGRNVTVLDGQGTSSQAMFNALSLANPPLKIPVTLFTGADTRDSGLAANKAFSVLGTSVDQNGEQMVMMHKPAQANGMLRDMAEILNVPLSTLKEAIMLTIIADGRPELALINPQDPLNNPTLASCCMHTRSKGLASGGGTDTLRVFDAPTRLQDHRCMSCAFARNLCVPQ